MNAVYSDIQAGEVRTREPSAHEQEVNHHNKEAHQAGVSDRLLLEI